MTEADFEARVTALTEDMYRVAATLLRGHHDRQDAVQECIWKAWRNLRNLRDDAAFRPWLMRILINECRNLARRTRGEVPTDEIPDRPQAEDAYEQRLRDEGLHQALMRLPEKIRLTMVLFYLDGFSQREICGILRVPAGTVKSRLNQGRKQLKKQLESEV